MPIYIFGHDNGIINQQSHTNHQSHDSKTIQGLPHEKHGSQCNEETERNSQRNDHGHAKLAQKKEQYNGSHDGTQLAVTDKMIQALHDFLTLIVINTEIEPLQFGIRLDLINGSNHTLTDLHRVGLPFPFDLNPVGRLRIVTIQALGIFRLINNLGDVLEKNIWPNWNILYLLKCVEFRTGFESEFLSSINDRTTG